MLEEQERLQRLKRDAAHDVRRAQKQAARAEQVGFARGVQAERAASKQKKIAKKGGKKERKRQAAAARRNAARARQAWHGGA